MENTRTRAALQTWLAALLLIWLVACSPFAAPDNQINPEAGLPTVTSIQSGVSTKDQQPTDASVHTDSTAIPNQTELTERSLPERRPALNTILSGFTTADFTGPSICAMCHLALTDQTGTNVSMIPDWRATLMANASKDPAWQAKVSSEAVRLPAIQDVIEKKCAICHMPMATTQAVTDGQPVQALGEGFLNPAHPLHAAGMDGVSCTLCHQIQADKLGSMEGFSGGFVINTATNPPARLIFGPYQQPVTLQMRNHTGFTPTYGEHMLSAEHCASCHNLYTPYVDAQGTILGEFPEQTPYTEWQNSAYGLNTVSCQSCHMPITQGGVVVSTMPGNLQARQPFFQHYFVGGNAFILQIFADWGADLELTANPEHLDATQARVIDQITNRTATLTLTNRALQDGVLSASLQVNPLTGHKFPTGIPFRRAWLHVTLTDANGQIIFESGRPNPDGTIMGNDTDLDAAAFEPHHDLITGPEEVQIYEAIMADSDGKLTYTLLRAASYLKDNRLLPAGADKDTLPADISVYGKAREDENFTAGSDQITYRMDVSKAQGPFTINARLLYAPLSYRFVQDMLIDQTTLTDRFGVYYNLADKTPLVVASIAPATVRGK